MPAKVFPVNIKRYENGISHSHEDLLAVEEPLEIRLGFGKNHTRQQKSLAITMRTPGNDEELVLGFLFSENIIQSLKDVSYLNYCKDENNKPSANVIRAEIQPEIDLNWEDHERHFFTNSSCGICGKASIEKLENICPRPLESGLQIDAAIINGLPDKMRAQQNVFEYTGGLHAAALFSTDGELLLMREDIGRHNALDKLVGGALLLKIDLSNSILVLSGRSSYELIQKATMAGIPIVVAVGAPSSLAVKTAQNFGITLLGFTNKERFNIYSHNNRLS